jgi:elongation factor Ts
MADISAKDVAALRKETGAGMMDCKRALEENDGDFEAAKKWLREKGLSSAAKRQDRDATEGAVEVATSTGAGAIAEITCETDFVAKGDDVRDTLLHVVASVLADGEDGLADRPFAGDTINGHIKGLAGKLGENIGLGRTARFETTTGIIDGYKHIQADRGVIGVLVQLEGVDPSDDRAVEVAHDIALHIASAAPRYLRRDDVPESVVAAEREVLETLTRNEGKPEQAIPKIVEGRIGGFFKDIVLLEQGYVREPKTTIAALLATLGPDAHVAAFRRIKVGEA